MIKYIKILEEENEEKKRSTLGQTKSGVRNPKTTYQIVDEIIKLNSHIFQQIHKFQEQCNGMK